MSGGRRGALLVPQRPEQFADVAERPPGRARDRAERLVGHRGVGLQRVPRTVGLRDHHGEGVRDDVVHVAGDADALLLHGDRAVGTSGVSFRQQLGLTTHPRGLARPGDHATEPRQQQQREHDDQDGAEDPPGLDHRPVLGRFVQARDVVRDPDVQGRRQGTGDRRDRAGDPHSLAAVRAGRVHDAGDEDVRRVRPPDRSPSGRSQ